MALQLINQYLTINKNEICSIAKNKESRLIFRQILNKLAKDSWNFAKISPNLVTLAVKHNWGFQIQQELEQQIK